MSRSARGLVAALASITVAVPMLAEEAGAAVEHQRGFTAVVAGFRSWYGSYGMGALGTAWCVDHGPPAPDADLDYGPAVLSERAASTRQAMAWALGAHGPGSDPVSAAALQLVLHDLMGARYPAGVLDVDRLRANDLSGFGGQEQLVLDRARAVKAEAVARSALRGPLALDVRADPERPGQPGTVVARLHDSGGTGVPGVRLRAAASGAVLTGAAEGTSDRNGEHRFAFTAGGGANRFEVSAVVPGLELQSFAPRRQRAQRVARPASERISGTASFTAVPPRRFRIRKQGDASAYLPLAGARFTVSPPGGPPVATLVTDASGSTEAVELPAGRYQVREEQPPAGYAPAGPWSVDLTSGDATLEVTNLAVPGRLELSKVDGTDGKLLDGARLALAYDADRDGRFERQLETVTTTATGPTVRAGLLPGNYAVTELSPPPGYRPAATPWRVTVTPGGTARLRVANSAVPEAPPAPAPPPAPTPPAAPAPPRSPQPSPGLAATGAALATRVWLGTAMAGLGAVVLGLERLRRRSGPGRGGPGDD